MHRDPKIICKFGKHRLQEIARPKWSTCSVVFMLARSEQSDKLKTKALQERKRLGP